MKSIKLGLDFYINSSIHVALAVVALTVITYWHLGNSPDITLLSFVFFASISGYNFVKYAGIAKLHHRSLAKSLQTIQILSLISFLFLIWLSLMLPLRILFWSAIFGLVTLLYALPVLSKRRNLRSIAGAKIFVIALVWSGVTVFLPAVEMERNFNSYIWLEFAQRFLLMLVLILPFEIRDLKYDLERLGTIPQRIGVTGTKILTFLLLIVVLLLELLKVRNLYESLDLLVICVFAAIAVLLSKRRQSKYYTSFWVEAIPVLWMLILWTLRAF